MEDDVIKPGEGTEQKFVVTVTWSPESEFRLTEGDVKEAIEELVMDMDEEAVADVAGGLDSGG